MSDSIWGHIGKAENILDFKAGQLFRRGNMIHADAKKGRVTVFHDPNRLLHVKWMTRPDGKTLPEEDLIIMPGDCKFKKLEVEDGRVFVLEFVSGKERFFWLQEPSKDDDEDIFKKMDEIVTAPEKKEEATQQQEQMMKGYREKRKEDEKKKKEKASQPSGLSKDMFDEAMSGLLSGMGSQEDPNKVQIHFNDVLHSRRLEEILVNDPSICEMIVGFLPKGTPPTPEAVMTHIRSPQFRQSVNMVNMAMYSGQVEGRTLGFDVPSGCRTVESVCRQLEKKYDKMEDED